MKLKVPLLLIIALFFSSCGESDLIITDNYAYRVGDDSLSVVADFVDTNSNGQSRGKGTLNLSSDVPPKILKSGVPKYPSLKMGESSYLTEGETLVKMWITDQGNVKRAFILKSSNKVFNKASLEAAMEWKFKPALIGGKSGAVWVAIPFHFRLR